MAASRAEWEYFEAANLFPEEGAFCISNPHLPDMPVTYANKTFCEQTGFDKDAIVGTNCRFLQAPEYSDLDTVTAMRDSFAKIPKTNPKLSLGFGTSFRIVNQTRTGDLFLNLVHMAPIYDSKGNLARIVGVQYGLRGLPLQIASIVQGVLMPDDEINAKDGDLTKWNARESRNPVDPTREAMIAQMEKVFVATLQQVGQSIDWAKVSTGISKRSIEAPATSSGKKKKRR